MYSPDFYRAQDLEPVFELIRKHPFATLLTIDGDEISHLPFVLEKADGGRPTLLCHMARANSHWRELKEKGRAKVIFQGPHGYISPAWYQPRPGNVPTWNYTIAHVTGTVEFIEEARSAFQAMNRLVETFESYYKTAWRLPQGETAIERLMQGIVVFKITALEFDAKFKLSQKQDTRDRDNVIAQLKTFGSQTLDELSEQMTKILPNPPA